MQSIDSRIITNTKSGNNHRTKRGSRKWKSYPHCLRDGPELHYRDRSSGRCLSCSKE